MAKNIQKIILFSLPAMLRVAMQAGFCFAFSLVSVSCLLFSFAFVLCLLPSEASAASASFYLSPPSNAYVVDSTFSVKVKINTNNKPINAAEGVLIFNPDEVQVSAISKTGSIFNLWTTEPVFSNSAGNITSKFTIEQKTSQISKETFGMNSAGTPTAGDEPATGVSKYKITTAAETQRTATGTGAEEITETFASETLF